MQNKNNISTNTSDFLAKISKKNAFKVPQDYFEELPQVVNNKILNIKYLINFNYHVLVKYLLPLSAACVIIIFIYKFSRKPNTNPIHNVEIAQINEEFINEDDLDEDLVIDAYIQASENEKVDKESQEEINYLIDNDISIDAIINEL